jgi:hypothetical protein
LRWLCFVASNSQTRLFHRIPFEEQAERKLVADIKSIFLRESLEPVSESEMSLPQQLDRLSTLTRLKYCYNQHIKRLKMTGGHWGFQ